MNRKRILIVDDNEVILKTLSMKLQEHYDIVTAMDGSQAVGAVRRERPDLILLDISFPSEVTGVPWDGFRIIQWLRRMDGAQRTPIIVITGSEDAKFKERALAEGAVAFFQKPIDNDELLKVLQRTLNEDGPAPSAT